MSRAERKFNQRWRSREKTSQQIRNEIDKMHKDFEKQRKVVEVVGQMFSDMLGGRSLWQR